MDLSQPTATWIEQNKATPYFAAIICYFDELESALDFATK
ncbi:hypothetical protein D082_20250 [Synechocystis sp. PCC 6714]|nr:hypothetical protein D082_20250 [Synechocystis sp. PCC 6714]